MAEKRRVLVVGGTPNSIPAWMNAAFTVEHVGTERSHGKLEANKADVVLVVTDQVAYDFSQNAHELGRAWGVPVLHAKRGWSSALAEAARIGLTWLVDGSQNGGKAVAEKSPEAAKEAEAVVENAWKETAEYERERAKAAEDRVTKERVKREQLEATLAKARAGAQERIISEIRRRAAEVRASEHQKLAPVRKAAADLVRSVRRAQTVISDSLADVDKAREHLNRLLDAESVEMGRDGKIDSGA